MEERTIAAIATALGNSGISVIRVSGTEAVDIVNRIFDMPSGRKLSDEMDHTINYGHIVFKDEIIDEVMVSFMKAPESYTGEDVVEINTHGGIYVTKKVLSVILESGAYLAEPGEFSKRAFLNGKMDLTKAEAVMDIISADSELALRNGISQLSGSIADEIKDIREIIINDIAHIEAALDDPEHIDLTGFGDELYSRIKNICERLSRLSESTTKGRIIREGIRTVILGKPNAGKSSLMNALLGTDRAIVTDIAGTTRDSLEESLLLGDVKICLTDTAGIRETEDSVEKIGVERSISLGKEADLILYVADSSVPIDDNDRDIIHSIKGKNVIVIYNKTDKKTITDIDTLCKLMEDNGHNPDKYSIVPVSVKNREGIEDIADHVKRIYDLGDIDISNEIMLTNLRQKNAIDRACDSLEKVMTGLDADMPEDFLTIDMMDAYSFLGEVIGESLDDDLVNTIFSRFCMGK